MFPRVLIVALCLTLLSCKSFVESYTRSSSGVSALDKKLLYDFRVAPAPILRKLSQDEKQMALVAVPPASCPLPPNAPRTTPQISSAVNGSFTYATEQETAFLLTGLACGPHNSVLVFSSAKLQAHFDTHYSRIIGSYDLNGDDKNEMLLSTQTERDGAVSREASLDDFEKKALHTVENFGIVYHDVCALFAGADEVKKKQLMASGLSPSIDAIAVYYLPRPGHQMPSFTVERYRALCSAPAQWQRVGVR